MPKLMGDGTTLTWPALSSAPQPNIVETARAITTDFQRGRRCFTEGPLFSRRAHMRRGICPSARRQFPNRGSRSRPRRMQLKAVCRMSFSRGRHREGCRQWRKASAQYRRISSPNASDDTGHSAANAVIGTFLEPPGRPSGETSQASPRARCCYPAGNGDWCGLRRYLEMG